MSLKGDARRKAKELKAKGVPFLLRTSLAKKLVRGKRLIELLEQKGAKLIRSSGCDCCDPSYIREYLLDGRTYLLEWGSLVDSWDPKV